MSNVYLVRHGQAGTRDAYDSLSELGRRQARLLGGWFAAQKIHFATAYSGELSRQRETAEETRVAYGHGFPGIIVDTGWNEFDLDHMYRELAPQLCAENTEFRRDYEAMRHQVHAAGGADDAPVHRRWLPCDTVMVNAWIAGRFNYAGESWPQFCQRVAGRQSAMRALPRHENVVVFTSATPIAVWVGGALDITDARVMKLAGALLNASISLVRLRDSSARLFSFNETPHLPSPELRTFR